jgi:DNA invertase Pin-like site-specific DNA recombinase
LKGKVDLVLFTKWDRFSRNAYQMISMLRRLGVEAQAIEQPLDLSIPENKMMLAFYLAAPEVENDRRASNTFHGMRRARKEGRYMGQAPVGYVNKITPTGNKYITFREPYASILEWCIEELAQGVYCVEDVRRQALRTGLKCSKTCFWNAIQNPLYSGNILLPKYKDEESRLVQGQHEALISETLFYDVQDAIDGKRKRQRHNVRETSKEMFPLRGFLQCPRCEKILTSSGSKGRNGRYFYYHCRAACGYRESVGTVDALLIKELQKFKPHKGVVELFKIVVGEDLKRQIKVSASDKKKTMEEMDKLNSRLGKARELLLTSAVDFKDYQTIKSEIEGKLVRLQARLTENSKDTSSPLKVEKLLEKAVKVLSALDTVYSNGDLAVKRQLIGSIFPEQFVLEKNNCRNARVNEVAGLIFLSNSELTDKKSPTNFK